MTQFSPSPTDAELARYLAKHGAAFETQRIDAWLSESVANRARLAEIELIWNAARPSDDVQVGALWSRVRARTVNAELLPPARDAELKPTPRRPMHSVRTIASAAALLIAVAGTLVVMQQRSPAARTTDTAGAVREYSTGRGEHVTMQLADGSRMTLAPRTRVRILPGFGGAAREIDVDGEVMLDVVHDTARPFRVHIGNAVAEDLGTRFDIRSYAGDVAVTVAVAEGAVSLGQRRDTLQRQTQRRMDGVVLRAGDVGRLDGAGRVTTHSAVTLNDYFGWTSGSLTFDNLPLEDVRRTLERWHDVHVRIDDATLRTRRLTARFDGQSVHDMIGAIATTLDVDAEWRGNTVTLSRRQ